MTPRPANGLERVVVLVNCRAGSIRQRHSDIEEALRSAFAHHKIAADFELIDGDGLRARVERARERAKRHEIDAIVIGGGDGSVHVAACVLTGTGIPLGIVPLGTLNHFAKDLGLPLRMEDAVATIAFGRVRTVDLAEVNGEIFINNSSIGIYPYMVIDRERRRTGRKLAKWTAMVPAFFRMLRHFPRRRLRISAEGFERPYRTPCLFVGNNEYSMELFTLGRRRRLDSGKLWFYVVKPREPLAFFWMVCRLCFGRMDQSHDLDTFELSAAVVTAKASRLPVALDGDVEVMHMPLHYRARPGALSVIVP
ncbi:MAG TPA: diacylglycerol kinase family protein [Methyloceanibacter sp.]|nr:diacylglycerol kinase family protein [Methyloceanibacter sp.]